jgi:isopenicillin N synthase-like dioxygenase
MSLYESIMLTSEFQILIECCSSVNRLCSNVHRLCANSGKEREVMLFRASGIGTKVIVPLKNVQSSW